MLEKQLQKYAQLAVRVGVNIQPGQTLFINAPLPSAPLVREIAKKAYEAGAKHVHVEWSDEEITYIKFKHAPEEALHEYPTWLAKGREEVAEKGGAFLSIYAPNPDLLKDIDPARVAAATKAASMALQHYRSRLMADHNCWSLIAVPTPAWAKKVFPNMDEDEAIAKLWDVIFQVTRVDQDDPIAAWKAHNEKLARIVDYLNNKQYKQLIYDGPGTNLAVALPDGHIWAGGAAKSTDGIVFNPNMPTEEVFTMPHKDGTNGVVRNTKPLNYGGNIIDGFTLTFKDGKVVDFTAEVGYDTLKHLLDTDEGARRLGEIALVPHRSPISQSNLVFYNTLFDENAASHLALGKAYPTNIEGGTNMRTEELLERGANDSLVHEDFMIGSHELNVDGITKDGVREPIMRNGEWVISI